MIPTLADLPVYVRPGTILPYEPLIENANEVPKGPLTLKVYPGPGCKGAVYLDDGHTFQYKDGASLRMTFSCEMKADGSLWIALGSHIGAYPPWWSQVRLEVFGLDDGVSVVRKGATRLQSISGAHSLVVQVPDNGEGTSLSVTR